MNVNLSGITQERLELLCEKRNISSDELIEKLIDRAYGAAFDDAYRFAMEAHYRNGCREPFKSRLEREGNESVLAYLR